MSTYRLTVKGNLDHARHEAVSHGLTPCGGIDEGRGTSTVLAEGQHVNVVTWFAESPHNAPFPAGTLLFYSEMDS